MSSFRGLHTLLEDSAVRFSHRTAVEESESGSLSYSELDHLSDRVRAHLAGRGVRPGDRVGVYLRKSADSVAAFFGILKAGAAYVPVDPGAPPARNAYIFHNGSVRTVLVERRFLDGLKKEWSLLGAVPDLVVVEEVGSGTGLGGVLPEAGPAVDEAVSVGPDDPAYILYTSGSTGKPKGVILSHRNAVSFVEWCSETFFPVPDDRFSSHAPFHFDLSILDIYVPLKHGATLVLVGEDLGKDPGRLGKWIAEKRITSWYSAPSILSLLVRGGDLGTLDLSALRTILFAGEVFPVGYLRALKQLVPHPRYCNLYGPTETNVCTWYEIPVEIPEDRTAPYPIGKVCSHLRAIVLDPEGREVADGSEGELCIAGDGVTSGYWGLPEQTAKAFIRDTRGDLWYRTGDLVTTDGNGDYVYVGRRDRMVKKRGYRVELGEIEACLYQHPEVAEAAVIAREDPEGIRVDAFITPRNGGKISLIQLKRFCSERIPLYMIPDRFSFHETLPKTSTDKIDYQKLKELA